MSLPTLPKPMAEYEAAYAAARVADIDARIEALKVEAADLAKERERYAPAKKARARKSDDES